MKRFLSFLIFGILVAIGPLFAQEDPADAPRELLVTDEFAVISSQRVMGNLTKKIEATQVYLVSLKEETFRDTFTISQFRLTTQESPGKPIELIGLAYISKVGTDDEAFEFLALAGQNPIEVFEAMFGKIPSSLEVIDNRLLFQKDLSYQIKDKKGFLRMAMFAVVFAGDIVKEAENFDEEKGLPEDLIKQIPVYLEFDPTAWGLEPAKQ